MRLRFLGQALGTSALFASLVLVTVWGWRHAFVPMIGRTASVSATPAVADTSVPPPATATPTPAPPAFPGLSVKGTNIISDNGQAITLIGATRPSLEYFCAGDGHFQPSDFAAMRAWGMNVVRLTLSSEFWANHGDACANYHQTVHDAVAAAEAQGLYVILTLQWNAPLDTALDRQHGGAQCPLPDTNQDVAFWRDLATNFHDDHHVIFDLFGEPHDVSWTTWYYGGPVAGGCALIQTSGSTLEYGSYTAIGMHDLAVLVHTLAPHNTLMVAGLDWGYDLSKVESFPLGTTNVLYDTHPFDYGEKQPIYWDRAFGNVAQHAAVIAGEFGSYDCRTTYSAQLIAYLNRHHISWLAWAWNPSACSGPTIIADWSGTPTTPYGAYIHDQILRAQNMAAGR